MLNKCLILLLFIPFFSLSLLSLPRQRHVPVASSPPPPRFAYYITGSAGDGDRLKRLLLAVYHPLNYYLLHLDRSGGIRERTDLDEFVGSQTLFVKFGNVRVVKDGGGIGDVVTKMGPTVLASMLHGVAVLLRENKDWSWFVNLSAEDYPLMSQDDILHIFSYLPRHFNFIKHTSDLGWQEYQRARPIIVDTGLFGSSKTDLLWAKEKRSLPSSFKLFVGSSSVVLTRSFLEFCIWGWDNLPRTLLMYYTNFFSSSEGYFHTVMCNSMDFQSTAVNDDLRFMVWDNPPGQYPLNLTSVNFNLMEESGAPFARTFVHNDPVLDRIDSQLLKRKGGQFTPGGWCRGKSAIDTDRCAHIGDARLIIPSVSSRKLERLLVKLLDPESFRAGQCI